MKLQSRPFLLFILSLSILLNLSRPAEAEGELRERFKERIKERIVQKIEEAPAPEVNADITDKITKSGDYYFSIQHDNLARMYHVHVPPGYNPATPAMVVFAFHGGGGDMEYMAKDEYYGLISKADQENTVIVFPNGYSNFQSGKLATWNAGACCGDAREKNIDDAGFVKQIVTNLHNQMNIDRNKIFATGMSNGGLMSYRLACEMADTFTAIASVAGTDNTLQCNPSQPVSIMHIHARNDTHVLFEGGAGKDSFQDISKVTEFTSVAETISRWVKRNQCNPAPQRVLDVAGAYCDLYSACADGVEVKLCVTESGGHSWPGGFKPGGRKQQHKEPTSKAISANDEMWEFFKSRH